MRYSIITPVYNAQSTLPRCLDSIVTQKFSDYELLLINDGSKDDSDRICREYAEKYPQIRYFPKENGGVSSARNLGLEQARGEYILFVDSDDDVSPDYFAVSVGELQEHKNHEVVIRALGKAQNPNIYYGICGRGELQESLQKLAEELGAAQRVKFFGYRKDIPEILHAADLFVFPSKRDGLGLAALEAMASQLPLLTSNIRGVSDYVIDGESGYRYAPDNADGFAEGLLRYLQDPELCNSIGQHNAKAVQKYDIRKIEADVRTLMNT